MHIHVHIKIKNRNINGVTLCTKQIGPSTGADEYVERANSSLRFTSIVCTCVPVVLGNIYN